MATLIALVGVALGLPYAWLLPNSNAAIPERPFAESRFVDVEGLRIHVREWPGTLPARQCPLLLVHGFAGSTFTWRGVAPMLSRRGQRVVAVDLPGMGYSERGRWTDETTALWKLLDTLGPPGESWCLGGHSMGARVIAAMATAHPERTLGMIYVDGLPIDLQHRELPAWYATALRFAPARQWLAVRADREWFAPERFEALLRAHCEIQEPTAEQIEGYYAPLRVRGTAQQLGLRLVEPWPVVDPAVLGKLPTLIVLGRDDRRVPAEVVSDLYVRYLRQAKVAALGGSGHCPMESDPMGFFGVVAGCWDSGVGRGGK